MKSQKKKQDQKPHFSMKNPRSLNLKNQNEKHRLWIFLDVISPLKTCRLALILLLDEKKKFNGSWKFCVDVQKIIPFSWVNLVLEKAQLWKDWQKKLPKEPFLRLFKGNESLLLILLWRLRERCIVENLKPDCVRLLKKQKQMKKSFSSLMRFT